MAMKDKADSALRSHVTSVKEDVMTGVSFMIPFVTIGGIFLALAYAAASLGRIELFGMVLWPGGTTVENVFGASGTFSWFLSQMGTAGLSIMVPILGGYIAYAIADRPGLAPGFLLSYIIQQGGLIEQAGSVVGIAGGNAGAGYLGALVAGLLAGYVARWIKNWNVHDVIKPMMPVLIIPVLTTMLLFPIVVFVLGVPVAIANAALTDFLSSMQGSSTILVGALLGAMMAFDMGGPVNKVAYVFAVGLLAAEGGLIGEPMAAVMIAGMIPPIGMALSNFIAPHKYAAEMYENAKSGVVLGFSFITEGAIPYAAADPIRVIPSIMLGSATGAAASMFMGVSMPAPHGGIFVVPLSNQPFMFLACIVLGSLVTAAVATVIKPDYDDRMAEETEPSAQVSD